MSSQTNFKQVLVSFIIPLFNNSSFIERCLSSLKSVTYSAEFIVVDDGSTDDGGAIVKGLSSLDKRILYFKKENGGLSSARNFGLLKASGVFVSFIDSDDYVDSNVLRLGEILGSSESVDAFAFPYVEEKNGILRVISPKTTKDLTGFQFCLQNSKRKALAVIAPGYIFLKSFLEKNNLRFFEGIIHEDSEFMPRVLALCNRIRTLSFPFYHYLIRTGSLSTSSSLFDRRVCSYRIILANYQNWGPQTLSNEEIRFFKSFVAWEYLCFFRSIPFKASKKYINKSFVWENYYGLFSFAKSRLFCFSPWLYYYFWKKPWKK